MPSVEGAASGLYHNFQLNALQAEAAKAGKNDKAKKTGTGLFAGILKKAVLADGHDTETSEIAARLENLSRDEAAGLLLEEVRAAGSALKDSPYPDEIINYKKSVRAFMRFVVDTSFDVESSIIPFNKGPAKAPYNVPHKREYVKSKQRVQVVVIDQKLEQLAAELLSSQVSQMTLLSRIEQINGLLVDMLK